MKRWSGSAFVDLTVAKRWNGSAWVDLTLAKRWDGASWVDIPLPGGGSGSLSVTISPGFANASFTGSGGPFKTISTGTVTATASGGTAPITGVWTKVSGDSAILASSPNTPATAFSGNVPKNGSLSAVWKYTATDAGDNTDSAQISITLTYNSGVPA